jgi:putative membrane protein
VRGHVRTRLGAIDADAAASLAGDVAARAAAPDTVAAATEREESHA